MNVTNTYSKLFTLYVLSTPIYALFNPSSILPITLIISMLASVFIVMHISFSGANSIQYRMNYTDIALMLFLFLSLINVIVNHGVEFNANHLYAYWFVIFFYYFVIKIVLINSYFVVYQNELLKVLCYVFVIIILTAILDYVLLIIQIDIADIFPMGKTGVPVMIGPNSRPKGFFVEPTDLAIALNVITPFVLVYLYSLKKYTKFYFVLALYLLTTVVVRSSAGIAGASIGLMVATIDYTIRKRHIHMSVNKISVRIFLITAVTVVPVVLYFFQDMILDNMYDVISKIFLLKDAPSVNDRVHAWGAMIDLFLSNPNVFNGFGLGYLSGNDYITHNWYLSILLESGLFGLFLFIVMISLLFYRIIKTKSQIRFALYVSFISILIHFFTYSGFYHSFLWLLFILIYFPWKRLSVN